MKKKFITVLVAIVLVACACPACAKDATVEQSFIQSTTDYIRQFTDETYSEAQRAAAESYVSEIGGIESAKMAQSRFEAAQAEIAKGFYPEYKSSARIDTKLQSGVQSKPLKFNDAVGKLFGSSAPLLGGGRASFSAGEIASESDKKYTGNAIYTLDEFEKINALNDAALKEKMLKVDSVNDLIRSSVVSFTANWEFVLTTHYTQLGCDYLNAAYGKHYIVDQEYIVLGTCSMDSEPIEGTNDHKITVQTDDRMPGVWREDVNIEFVFNAYTGVASRVNYLFDRISYVAVDEMNNLTGGSDSPSANLQDDEYVKSQGITVYKDVKYGDRTMQAIPDSEITNDNKEQAQNEKKDPTILTMRETLTLYAPKQEIIDAHKTTGNGVILMIHGGSWVGGDKSSILSTARDWALKGYFVAAMNHTYGTRKYDNGDIVTFFDIQNEIDAAMKKIKSMSDENGWNINKSATHGYSSGSHLATWYAYDMGNRDDAPIPVVATFSLVGPMSFYLNAWYDVGPIGFQVATLALNDNNMCFVDPSKPNADNLTSDLIAAASDKNKRKELNEYDYTAYSKEKYNEKIDSISPLSFAKKGDCVPTVLGEACQDTLMVSPTNGYLMEEALTQSGVEHDVIMFANSDHFCTGNAECGNVYRKSARKMIEKYFGY